MYKVDKDKTRSYLPKKMYKNFDDIVEQKVLGASTHIKMIADMIDAICEDELEQAGSTKQVIARVEEVTNFFIHTRGEASQAITNAIYLMIQGLHKHQNKELTQAVKEIREAKDEYQVSSKEASQQAISYAVEIGNSLQNILVYDYSSTVETFLKNLKGKKKIYIAESRVINGGKPFVKTCIDKGHQVHFIPDAALMYYMKDCDAAFMGAETILPDGTGYNTTGSDIVGLLCEHYNIPLYFISPLIKVDIRPVKGKEKKLVYNDLTEKFQKIANPEGLPGEIDYTSPELIPVASKYICAFITEQGVIPSYAMYDICIRYIEQLKGGL